ncbi:MAG TPA: phosphate acyltransferase PlsX [Syntrophorhabdaceae bacterium]|nr:phosphate acyltransferase PlsX [Syntrophorhabdaceae bacterium]HNS14743.1 phosphate acyltransferase PlsX [Syntrophorhabdaceae bacterium]HNT68631.1 phosphate acyltransferase PlsX [Syntrophorhabdaceae bacterium]
MIKIAVDGMGGDYAPAVVVSGAESVARDKIAEIVLVGNEDAIRPLLKDSNGIEVIHTPVFVEMKESPSSALRKKRESSINKALELLKSGKVQAVVTAGNSGAAMAFAIFTLGRIGYVDRPAIATLHPNTRNSISILLDAGGNVDCKPIHLAQFAVMGDAFARCVLGVERPKIGLLSNGEEETKGNELTREAHALIKGLDLNYIGYVEGTDMHNGRADVVVSDGFVGNVALKITEGVAESLMVFFKDAIKKNLKARMGHLLMKEVFDELKGKMDPSEYGGAPLLGVDGVCIICHGKSDEKAIRNAVLLAKRFVENGLNESIKETLWQVTDQYKG